MSQLLAQAANFGGGFTPPANNAFTSGAAITPLDSLETIISNGIGVLTVVAGIFFIIYFFLGAFKWLTAGGDAGKVQKARDEMVQGVLGLIIIVLAYSLIGLVGSVIGLNLLKPAAELQKLVP